MKILIATTLLSLVAAAAEAGALFTPETSHLFERKVEPLSGHAYCLLKPFAGEHSRQSLYFTAKSMTDDGRFLLFWGYDGPEDGTALSRRMTHVVDFAADRIVKLPIPPQIPFVDVKTDQVFYFRRDPSGDLRKDAVCRLDLKKSLTDEIFVCNVPEALVKDVKKVHYYSTHPTLTRDRRKMFIAAHLDDRYVQGCINLETGAWERWGQTPFYANHDQLCPADDNLALIAWEACARTEDALAYRKKTGWYPRMWLCRPDGSRELQPSKLPDHNYATHEHWTEDGTGFYWCHACVLLQDLATGKQSVIVPWKAAHAAMTADNRYVTFDYAVGKWYRGCPWQVGFWNREAGRGTYIFPYRPALCSDTPGSKRHPDPHPQFVCNDRYVVCTINSADGHMDLAVVPVDQLVARTAVDPMSFFADLPAETAPAHVSKRLAEHFLECPADGWGRGAGWKAAGMTLVLRNTSPQSEDYHRVLGSYRRMMSDLLKCQRKDGLWGGLAKEPSSSAETSGSAMFAFAFVEGVRNGWLEPETYGPAARKAYLALIGKLDEYANLRDVCIGTGKRNDHQYYLDRPREAGDPHGQATILENADLAIEIDDTSYAVRSITNKKAGGVTFVEPPTNAVLWTAEFRAGPADAKPVRLTSNSPCRTKRIERRADGGAALVWEGLDLGDERDMVTVRAVVRFASDGSSKWTLDVENRSLRRGLFATRYPVLPQVVGDGTADCLLPRPDTGARLVRGMKRGKAFRFGCMGYFPMMVAFLKGDAGLYVAAHDGTARIKDLEIDKELGVSFSTPTENGGVAGLAANGPRYETTVAAFRGDWWEAARLYRAWALTTRWAAKGPIVSRTDYPKRMAEIPVWLNIHGSPAEVSNVMTRARAVFPNFDCGIHWHVWQHSKHDINYPEYFPEQDGTAACFAYLKSIGEEALPYTNGRLWSTNLVSYPYVLPYVCKKPDGSPYVEQYGKVTPPMSPMCPSTPQWDRTVNDFSSRVLALGANSIFLDQIGACSARTCYDVNHGHPIGGGTWYFDGYQRLLAKTHALYSSQGAFITTEGSGEEWMNVVDGYLCVTQRQPDDVPFFHAVYNGYTTYFCSPENQDDDLGSFRAAQTRELLWGQALGWYHPLVLDQPDKCALLRRLGEFRQANLDFFAYGMLVGEVKFKEDVPPVKLAWLGRKPFYMWAFKDYPLSPTIHGEMPSVFGYVWKSADGNRTVAFLANVGTESQDVTFEFGGNVRRRSLMPGEIVCEILGQGVDRE